jgi:hypothetical protein
MEDRISPVAQRGGQEQRLAMTDSRGLEAYEWYEAVEDLDLAAVVPEDLRRLLGEARSHIWQLVQLCAEADSYEAVHERDGTHLNTWGTAAIVRGEDLLTIREALDAAILWTQDTGGSLEQLAKYRQVIRGLDEL